MKFIIGVIAAISSSAAFGQPPLQDGNIPQSGSTVPASAPLTADSPIETIAADPVGKAILEKEIPALLPNPQYEQFKAMSLRQIQPFSGGLITEEMVAKLDAELKAASKR